MSNLEKGRKRRKSTACLRVAYIFGAQEDAMGGALLSTIAIARLSAKLGMIKLGCNTRHPVQSRCINPCRA